MTLSRANVRKLKNLTVRVEDFGAVAGGVVDSAAAIQAAIDYVYLHGAGDVLFKGEGYLTSQRIVMKRGVNLVGPYNKISSAQIYGSNAEARIAGVSTLIPTAAINDCAVIYDFTLPDKDQRPYGSTLSNIMVDGDLMTFATADCLRVVPPPSGEGPFNTGWASGAVRAVNCVFVRAPRYGASAVSTDTEKTNFTFYDCRFAFNGSAGLHGFKCFDISADNCFMFANGSEGIYLDSCATERISFCDIFSNGTHGITADGYDGKYTGNNIDQNGGHGVNLIAVNSSITNKLYQIVGGRIGQNGTSADNTFSNIFFGDRAGVACANIAITGVAFGTTAQATANRLKNCIDSATLSSQHGYFIAACLFGNADIKSGNALFGDNFWQAANFSSCASPEGNPVSTKFRPIPAWTGDAAINALRGANFYVTSNSSAARISGIAAGSAYVQNRDVWVLIGDTNTGVDFTFTNLKGNGGVDLAAPAQGKLIHFKNIDGTTWVASIYG